MSIYILTEWTEKDLRSILKLLSRKYRLLIEIYLVYLPLLRLREDERPIIFLTSCW